MISGKQEKPKPRLRSTSLPRITSYGLIGFGTVEYDEKQCLPMLYNCDLGKQCNTFPRRLMKDRSVRKGRDRSASVSVDVHNKGSPINCRPRSSSSPRDVNETIYEEHLTGDQKQGRNNTLKSFKKEPEQKQKSEKTTVLCSTDL